MIPSRPPPKLTDQDKWSKDFNDFITKTLTKLPDQRPTATELLEHPFIKNAKTRVLLQPMLDQQDQIINRIGREAALGIEPDDDDDDNDDNDDDAGTVKRNDVKKSRPRAGSNGSDGDDGCGTVVITDTDSMGYGTTVITSDHDFNDDDDNTGTIKSTKSKGTGSYVPPFLDHIKKSLRDEKPPPITPGNPKYANLSLEQLKKMVEDIDIQKEKEIMAIKEKYATNKRSLMAAIEERNKQK
jgi:serine/threonine protein kinase